VVETSGDDV
jgi:hypothetical protein